MKLFSVFTTVLVLMVACEEPLDIEGDEQFSIEDFRAIAAAAIFANHDSIVVDPCGCYDIFDNIDYSNLPHEEVIEIITGISGNLSPVQQDYLFNPVCGNDGFVYESACMADCHEENYHQCSEAELNNYFFGGLDCDVIDAGEFPITIELPDGTTAVVNDAEELFEILNQWYEENDDWYEEDFYNDSIPLDSNFYYDCFVYVYPVSIGMGGITDDTIMIAYEEEDMYQILDEWLEDNFDTIDSLSYEDFPYIITPYQIKMVETEEVFTINSDGDVYQIIDEHCD